MEPTPHLPFCHPFGPPLERLPPDLVIRLDAPSPDPVALVAQEPHVLGIGAVAIRVDVVDVEPAPVSRCPRTHWPEATGSPPVDARLRNAADGAPLFRVGPLVGQPLGVIGRHAVEAQPISEADPMPRPSTRILPLLFRPMRLTVCTPFCRLTRTLPATTAAWVVDVRALRHAATDPADTCARWRCSSAGRGTNPPATRRVSRLRRSRSRRASDG